MTSRESIFTAINNERDYQDKVAKLRGWKENKSVGEFLLVMEAELKEAKDAWLKKGDEKALEELLQVVAVGVAALEINGVKEREEFHPTILSQRTLNKVSYDGGKL